MPVRHRPGESLVRMAWEADAGHIDPTATFYDFRIQGFSGGDDRSLISPGTLEPRSQRAQGLPSVVRASRELPISWEPSGFARMLASFQDAGDTPVVLTASESFQHRLAPNGANITFPNTFSVRIWNDSALQQQLTGCLLESFAIDSSVENVVQGTLGLQAAQTSFWDLATVILEGGSPNQPVLRGIPKYSHLNSADYDIYIKVGALVTEIQAKVGSAAAYSNTQTPVPGTPMVLLDEAGVAIGDPDDPIEFFVPLGATGWTITDEWQYISEHAAAPWTASLPALKAFNTIHATVTISPADPTAETFVPIKLRQAVVNASHTVDPDFGLGERYTSGLAQLDLREISWTINRRSIDETLVKRLISGEPFRFEMVLTSNEDIGASTDPYRMVLRSYFCTFEGETPNPSGPGTFEEPLTLQAFSSDDPNEPDDLTIIVENEFASLET